MGSQVQNLRKVASSEMGNHMDDGLWEDERDFDLELHTTQSWQDDSHSWRQEELHGWKEEGRREESPPHPKPAPVESPGWGVSPTHQPEPVKDVAPAASAAKPLGRDPMLVGVVNTNVVSTWPKGFFFATVEGDNSQVCIGRRQAGYVGEGALPQVPSVLASPHVPSPPH